MRIAYREMADNKGVANEGETFVYVVNFFL
jgi:hypothetical protein